MGNCIKLGGGTGGDFYDYQRVRIAYPWHGEQNYELVVEINDKQVVYESNRSRGSGSGSCNSETFEKHKPVTWSWSMKPTGWDNSDFVVKCKWEFGEKTFMNTNIHASLNFGPCYVIFKKNSIRN